MRSRALQAFSRSGGKAYADLLPLPVTSASLWCCTWYLVQVRTRATVGVLAQQYLFLATWVIIDGVSQLKKNSISLGCNRRFPIFSKFFPTSAVNSTNLGSNTLGCVPRLRNYSSRCTCLIVSFSDTVFGSEVQSLSTKSHQKQLLHPYPTIYSMRLGSVPAPCISPASDVMCTLRRVCLFCLCGFELVMLSPTASYLFALAGKEHGDDVRAVPLHLRG